MKISSDNRYNAITSFEDFDREKEILKLKSKLIETRINMEVAVIRQVFSATSMVISFAREFIMPKITTIIEDFLNSKKNSQE
jgi:hypothetical protein